jgi:sulfur carrier protein ThiS
MLITLKLFANLGDYLPTGSKGNWAEIEVDSDEPVAAIIERLALPQKWVHLVLVNGVYLTPEERGSHCLEPGDQLAVWPPIAGG